ncbi:MAG: SGNH/GDSL hydrolase family protein [Flavobacteriales bacterium]|nr:SGNH/GDSL hydrolase family protein [Flavobacteriales bacterium]
MNKQDYRDNIDYQILVENGKYRISIFGDSFTVGHGIKNVNDRFGHILRNKYSNLEVHNFSSNGANSRGNLRRLKDLKKHGYHFNIILLSYCMNDIDYLVINEASRVNKRIHNFNSNQSYFVKQSYFINNLAFRFFAAFDPDVKNYNNFLLDTYSGETLRKHFEELNKYVEFAKEENATLMVVTFPFLHTTYEDYQFKSAHQKLDNFWKSKNILHLDLTDTYKEYMGNQLTVNPYDAHPNEFAHRLAADAIDKFVGMSPNTSK